LNHARRHFVNGPLLVKQGNRVKELRDKPAKC
jgi:hypothetical protein